MQLETSLDNVVVAQRHLERRRWRIVAIFCVIAGISLILDIATGPSMLSPKTVFMALIGSDQITAMTQVIVYDMRLPTALMALVVGQHWVLVVRKSRRC
ncbi:hypothetical protein [Nitrincola sp. A-D6]|uniref:hypothetical protein n=1 Tax=Nitrincola sp. A-D6 TaxID=1545442 RepID=UPI000AE82328|nr:hypothetical protein [Nitrincola sp. A-D6]